MGVILDCACAMCDFDQHGIRLGSNMILGYNYFPAYQAMDKKIAQINIFRWLEIEEFRLPKERNEELTIFRSLRMFPYFDPSMFQKNGGSIELISEFPYLQSKYNYCPQCGNYGLEFKISKISF